MCVQDHLISQPQLCFSILVLNLWSLQQRVAWIYHFAAATANSRPSSHLFLGFSLVLPKRNTLVLAYLCARNDYVIPSKASATHFLIRWSSQVSWLTCLFLSITHHFSLPCLMHIPALTLGLSCLILLLRAPLKLTPSLILCLYRARR